MRKGVRVPFAMLLLALLGVSSVLSACSSVPGEQVPVAEAAQPKAKKRAHAKLRKPVATASLEEPAEPPAAEPTLVAPAPATTPDPVPATAEAAAPEPTAPAVTAPAAPVPITPPATLPAPVASEPAPPAAPTSEVAALPPSIPTAPAEPTGSGATALTPPPAPSAEDRAIAQAAIVGSAAPTAVLMFPDLRRAIVVPPPTRTPPVAPPSGPKVGATSDAPGYTMVRVYYGTDRNKLGGTPEHVAFGSERGRLAYGFCDISVPDTHQVGVLETASIWRLEFSEDPKKHIVLVSTVEQDKASFFKSLALRVRNSTRRSAMIFVHGYNVSFADAARRTAQMSYDLAFDGAPVFYSWPSRESVPAYPVDETNVEWSQAHLKEFLKDFIVSSETHDIFLIAHSLGSRAVVGAVKDLVAESPWMRSRLKEIVLAAPDIDADTFRRDIAPRIVTRTPSITLYTSSRDKAMVASRKFHGYARLGDATKGPVLIPGVDTIDSSDAEADLYGHFYYGESPTLISDLRGLIMERRRAHMRELLKPVETGKGRYWRLQPDSSWSASVIEAPPPSRPITAGSPPAVAPSP